MSLLYKLLALSQDGVDLFIGFDKNRERRVAELKQKARRRKFHVKVFLKDVFGFADHQKMAHVG